MIDFHENKEFYRGKYGNLKKKKAPKDWDDNF